MSRATLTRSAVALVVAGVLAACAGEGAPSSSSATTSLTSPPASTTTAAPTSTSSTSSTTATTIPPTTTTMLPPRIVAAADVVAYQASHGPGWFTESLRNLPEPAQAPEGVFDVPGIPVPNRREGAISPTLVASYVFLQHGDVGPDDLTEHAATMRSLFIRSSLMSFVDYASGRVLLWDRRSADIPMDLEGVIRKANQLGIPVFLEINYSDWVPGPIGTGVEGLVGADNVAGTVAYLQSLQEQGLQVEGVTFGDEIGDEAGFGTAKPTLANDDLIGRYISYATALKTAFPELKIYAFDSYIAATSGQVGDYFPLLRRIREAEADGGLELIDGFTFRESYVYMDEDGQVLDSQSILDDIESLAGLGAVTRYDVFGNRRPEQDRGYLSTLVEQVGEIFGRYLNLGITEYLPAGPVQISESDTSVYEDIDFLIHYADLVGTYAEAGLDVVSSWAFAGPEPAQQAECYVDRSGMRYLNYPVHEQLAAHLRGVLLSVERPAPYPDLRVKVYVAREGNDVFVLILNKDVEAEHTIRLRMGGEFDLTLRLPARSYTSLLVQGEEVTVTGVGPQ